MKRLLLWSTLACLATPALSQSLSLEGCRSDLYCPVIGDQTGEVLYLTRPVRLLVTDDGIRHADGRQLAPIATGALPVTDVDVDVDDGEEDHAGGHGCKGGKGKGKGGGKVGSDHSSGTESEHDTEEGAGGKAGQSCGPKGAEAEGPALEAPALGG